ncbi:hypothetical protein N7533_009417 [Penicillium manginii]|uniref:uncharacterized protein n=1 Tax=Penicillium manginii TaxID=203109 RepID=UPI00254950F5|nr:uncharacterized protein N7533_009417 [Penicillium manginii]KAJ5744547.1 hypothetical protein N7533_009417 [Penicillium manginii]
MYHDPFLDKVLKPDLVLLASPLSSLKVLNSRLLATLSSHSSSKASTRPMDSASPPPPFPPGPGGYPNMPYGAPPGWYPPPGPGFPQGPGQFPPQMPMGGPGQQQPPPQQQRPGPPGPPTGPSATSELPSGEKIPSKPATPAAQNAPPPPVESKPSVAEAVQGSTGSKSVPGYSAPQRNGRAMPAIPIAAPKPVVPMSTAPAVASQGAVATDATTAAANAVAAAMAKLPQPGAQKKPVQGQPDASLDTVTRKMNEMRPYDGTQAPRGGHQYPRGGRGGARAPHKKIEIPKSDYDFETANAKFNKQDLVKEAIATGSPAAEAESHEFHEQEVDDSATHNQYNRTSSFFDNISSEARDREENSTGRLGGREWRGEEEKRNIETFGQGSVDGYGRGRGRGRGRGFGRGRGYRGGYGGRGRGGRPPSQSTGIPSQV